MEFTNTLQVHAVACAGVVGEMKQIFLKKSV